MKIVIKDDSEAVSQYAAETILKRIQDHLKKNTGRKFVLGLPTGSTPIGVYKRLVEYHKLGMLSFKEVVTFNMDEYVGLARTNPQSYYYFMQSHLFEHVDLPSEQTHIPNSQAEDLEAECEAYEAKIRSLGPIDFFLAGIGQDGHLAFNEPGTSFASRTHVQDLTEDTVQANSRFFSSADEVPRKALTVGIATILDAKEVMVLATGLSKSIAVQHIVEKGMNHMWTASALQQHPNSIVVCDQHATSELKVKTYFYWRGKH